MTDRATPKPSYRKVVAALVESEERYRILVEGVRRYAIFMLDPKGIIMTWNRGIYELLGYGREEVVGQSGAIVFNAKDRAAGAFEKELARAKRSGESVGVHATVRKDGTELRVHDTATALLDSAGALIGFAKVARAIDVPGNISVLDSDGIELAQALARIEVEVEHRRRLEAQLLTAVEQERQRLGRDLHDDLSQRLAAIAMMMDTTAKRVGVSTEGRKKLVEVSKLLADAVGVARNLSRGLHPVTLTRDGLPAALAELAARVPKHVEYNFPSGERLDLEESVALHVYRIAEEAVGNAIRHSSGGKITIELNTVSSHKAILIVSDNGRGFRSGSEPAGMGLQNMKYRAGIIGGTLKISSSPKRGTRVQCTMPLLKRKASSPTDLGP
jgi:PAS domain S-box-containing protein